MMESLYFTQATVSKVKVTLFSWPCPLKPRRFCEREGHLPSKIWNSLLLVFFPLLLIRGIFDFVIALHSKQICLPNCVQLVLFPFRQIASTGRYDSCWLKDKLNGSSPIPTKLLSYVWSHWDHPIEVIVIVTCRTKPNGLLCYFHQYLSVYVHLSDIGIFIVYICPQVSAFLLVELFPHATLRFPSHNNFCLWNITSLMYLSE